MADGRTPKKLSAEFLAWALDHGEGPVLLEGPGLPTIDGASIVGIIAGATEAARAGAARWWCLLHRLGWRLPTAHDDPARQANLFRGDIRAHWCYFVGGPWDGWCEWVHESFVRAGVYRVADAPPIPPDNATLPLPVPCPWVDYRLAEPLPTGVPVFSCLGD